MLTSLEDKKRKSRRARYNLAAKHVKSTQASIKWMEKNDPESSYLTQYRADLPGLIAERDSLYEAWQELESLA